MVVDGLAGDIGMLAGWQVEALNGVKVREDIEGPEDRRPSDAEPLRTSIGHQIRGGKGAAPRGDEIGDRAARSRAPVTGIVEGGLGGRLVSHGRQMIPSLS